MYYEMCQMYLKISPQYKTATDFLDKMEFSK